MIPATLPVPRATHAKLLVVDAEGTVRHHARAEFLDLVREGDIVVANDAATCPRAFPAFTGPRALPWR